jgi:hypothetical protein
MDSIRSSEPDLVTTVVTTEVVDEVSTEAEEVSAVMVAVVAAVVEALVVPLEVNDVAMSLKHSKVWHAVNAQPTISF